MKLPDDKQKQFKAFTGYVKDVLPKLKDDELIVDSMCELVGIKKAKIVKALQWQNAPTIRIVKNLQCASEEGDRGCFRSSAPEFIEIDQHVVEMYEEGGRRNYRKTQKNRLPEVAVVLLHELVHWADYKVDQKHIPTKDPYHDIGAKWEYKAFTMLPQDFTDGLDGLE